MNGFGITDTGLVRKNNEDAIFVSNRSVGPLPNLYIIADGMGGHNAGEIASNNCIAAFCDYVQALEQDETEILDVLMAGVHAANQKVYHMSVENPDLSGMGCTLSLCVMSGGKLYMAHVGDSRVYVAHDHKLRQVSHDHTFVNEMVKAGEMTAEQAKTDPRRNLITRAVGTEEDVRPDSLVIDIFPGDTVLLCSDGLSNYISDEELLAGIQSENSLESKCETFVEYAKQKGGNDNISVILVSVNEVRA